jgi:L-lysine exporter family protein LysE/ArgO
MTAYGTPLIEGFILSAGLVMGIGPQDTLVLRQGLKRQHLLLVVLLCTLVDILLIGLSTFGMGTLLENEHIAQLVTYAGAMVLLGCGVVSFKSALAPSSLPQKTAALPGCKQIVLGLLAVSLLDPGLHLESLLIGGSAAHYQGEFRLWFMLGAMGASVIWFAALSYGSALMSPWLRQPKVLRGIDLLSGAILWLMAFRLLAHLA